jgi:uncharacterized protein YkwD
LLAASLAAAVSLTSLPQAARADVLAAVNSARQRGCPAAAAPRALSSNPRLQKAAGRLAGGAALREALAAVGYVASESFEVHFSGAVNDVQITQALTAHYCQTLRDPALRELGADRHGRELWMVLAAPAALSAPADAVAVDQRILELVNAARAAGRRCGATYFAPVDALELNAKLSSAALAHSRDMAQSGQFDHRGHDGSTPASRVERAGYGVHRAVGENIAAGAMTPAKVTAGWLASPPHCANIMDGRFTQIGVGYAANLNSELGMYWTQDFAAPR